MRTIILLTTFLLTVDVNGQSIWKEEIDLQGSSWKIEPMIKSNGQMVLHFQNNIKAARILIDEDRKTVLKSQVFSKNSPSTEFIGFSEDQAKTVIYLSNTGHTFFYFQIFDTTDRDPIQSRLNLELKKEKFVTSFSQNGICYLVTIKKKSSLIKIYSLKGSAIYEVNEYDFSDVSYGKTSWGSSYSNLFQVLQISKSTTITFSSEPNVFHVKDQELISMEDASLPCKFYVIKNKAILTLDHNTDQTILLEMNLNGNEESSKTFAQMSISGYPKSANSAIHSEMLFQSIVSSTQMHIGAYDLSSGARVLDLTTESNDSIWFRNTPLYLETSTAFYGENRRTITKSKKILKKLSSMDIGISVCTYDSLFEIKVGTYTETQASGPMGIPIGGAVSFGISSSSSKESFLKSLVSRDRMEHAPGSPKMNYLEILEQRPNSERKFETIFKWDNQVIYGYYDRREKTCFLERLVLK